MKARFPIGFKFYRKRFASAKEKTEYQVDDIITSSSTLNGDIVRIEYKISHEFMGQRVSEMVVDTTIARCLSNEEIAKFN